MQWQKKIEKSFDEKQIKSLSVKNGNGNTKILGKNGTKALVTANKKGWSKNCELDIHQSDKVLYVEVKKKASREDCRVDFDITLPIEADLDLKSGSGNYSIKEITGNFEIKMGSGDLVIEKSTVKKLDAKSGSGNVKMEGEIHQAEIKLGSGDADVRFAKVPTDGSLSIKSGSGDAQIRLPKDSKISVEFKAGSGKVSNEFENSTSAPYSITVKAGSGNLKVSKF